MATEPILGTVTTPYEIPADALPDYDKIVTEDDTPVDNIYSEKQQRLLTETLYTSWQGPGEDRPFLAASNVGVFYRLLVPAIVPDAFLSADVQLPEDPWPKQNRSYFIWQYGKPPDVVVEVVSNKEGEELGRKVRIYARIGVPFYVVWDPEQLLGTERLHIFALNAGAYARQASGWFPNINIGLKVWSGTYEEWPNDWLRWYTASGDVLATGAEAKQLAEEYATQVEQHATQAEQHAKQAEQRADQADQRATQAEQELVKVRLRAEKLADMLRSQGLEPPGNGQ